MFTGNNKIIFYLTGRTKSGEKFLKMKMAGAVAIYRLGKNRWLRVKKPFSEEIRCNTADPLGLALCLRVKTWRCQRATTGIT